MSESQRQKIANAKTYAELEAALNDVAIHESDAVKVAAFLQGKKSLNDLRQEIGMTARSQLSET